MKLFRINLLLFCATLLSGCISERDVDCPDSRSIVLEFAYEHNGNSIFQDRINGVDLFIFDTSGLLVHKETVGEARLAAFAGTSLHLAPGEYRVVAWGNAEDRSAFGGTNQGDHIDDAHVGRPGVPRNTNPHPGMGDKLHYASDLQNQATLIVPAVGNVTEVLPFSRAFVELDIYVVGYRLEFRESQAPYIELREAYPHYDFDRVPFGNIALREHSRFLTTLEEQPAFAQFRTKLFDLNAPDMNKELHIISAENSSRTPFVIDNATLKQAIADFMAAEGITSLEDGPDMLINIVITFDNNKFDVSVSINIPNFIETPVRPEM